MYGKKDRMGYEEDTSIRILPSTKIKACIYQNN